jgi:hypothetical protein
MKILLDPVYTNDPGHCASNVKMYKIASHLLEKRKDVFFYWLVPSWATEEEKAWYPKDERIKYIDYPYNKDRLREFMRVDRLYDQLISFQGDLWDVDLFVTNRASLVPLIKGIANKPSRVALNWSKRVVLIEDMPLMDFKLTVPLSNPKAQTSQTLVGYLNADTTIISAFWEKAVILSEAKRYLSPSSVKYIEKTMIESSAVYVEETSLKTKDSILRMLSGEREFTIGFVGRMAVSNKPEEIFDIMEKHWIFRAGSPKKIRCMISTQSANTGKVQVPKFVELHRPAREGFWELVRNEMDVFVFMSPEEDYSMSLMEPLILGCPAVVIRNRWSEPTLGKEYPFFANNAKEAYAIVRAFYEDYATQYKKFVEWSKKVLTPLLQERNKVYTPFLLEKDVEAWYDDYTEYVSGPHSLGTNEIVNLLYDYAEQHGRELVIPEAIKALDKQGLLYHLAEKLSMKFRERTRLTFATDWNLFRLGLKLKGYDDVSVAVGHMRAVA